MKSQSGSGPFSRKDRRTAGAELVRLECPECKKPILFLGTDPGDRESGAVCPHCHAYTPEYGDWVVGVVALIFPGRIVFANQSAVDAMNIEVVGEGGFRLQMTCVLGV